MSRSSLRRPFTLLAILLFAITAVAGCVEPEPKSPRFAASASGAVLYRDWAYRGGGESVDATISIDIDEVTNSGTVTVRGTMGDKNLTIVWDTFSHNADDFHSGGVAANFDEHGDSGVGNTLLPKMHLLLAAWGEAQILVDGEPVTDDWMNATDWSAHLMVTSTGVRDNAGQVLKADGTTPYDPGTPGDATIGSDLEVHLVLQTAYPNGTAEPLNETVEGSMDLMTPWEYTFELPTHRAHLLATFDSGGDPGEAGPFNWQLRNPSGQTVKTATLNRIVPVGGNVAELDLNLRGEGTWSIYGTSSSTPGTFTATIQVLPPPKPMYYFVWEDVQVDQKVVS